MVNAYARLCTCKARRGKTESPLWDAMTVKVATLQKGHNNQTTRLYTSYSALRQLKKVNNELQSSATNWDVGVSQVK